LEEGAGVGHVHVKVLLANAPKLQVNVIVVVLVDKLKVLHARLVHASVEIQHKSLDLFVPFGWLIKEEHDSFCVIDLKLLLYCLIFIS